jgi:hypothetical protein
MVRSGGERELDGGSGLGTGADGVERLIGMELKE